MAAWRPMRAPWDPPRRAPKAAAAERKMYSPARRAPRSKKVGIVEVTRAAAAVRKRFAGGELVVA